MGQETKLERFARYAWFVLAWNIAVILWGVFLRASKSGDGCGQHWVTCNGEILPSAPELKTVIEFSHRVTSSVAGILIIVLVVWALRRWYLQRTEQHRLTLIMAAGSLLFVIIEGLLGRSLVLTGNTAMNLTPERPFWMAGHLINTLILLAFITLTAYYASGGGPMRFRIKPRVVLVIALGAIAIFLVGISGSIAALSNMIFPSETLAEGVARDFSSTSNVLLRLRPLHPILAVVATVYLIFAAGWLRKESNNDPGVLRWSNILSLLAVAQVAFGAATLFMLGPIVLQLGHLLLADAVWIGLILLTANFLEYSSRNDKLASGEPKPAASV